jgi:cytochrome c biogenesis protein CcmG, thiol:disulfide interchange protein DsbE
MKFALLLAIAVLLASCSESRRFGRVGEQAPPYAARTIAGDTVRLSDLRGHPVLLNVWATWCIPCRKELPELQALHTQLAPRGLQVVGVSVDEGNDDDAVRDFAREFGITYTIVRDPATVIYSAFAIPGVPATFLIDRTGKVAWRIMGPFSATDTTLQAALKTVL